MLVHVNFTNSEEPVFEQETYEVTVNEHSPVGTVITTVHAKDPDQVWFSFTTVAK